MNKQHLSWLTSVPASDQNFKEALKKSNLATCEEALKHVTGKGARAAIEARIKKISRSETHNAAGKKDCAGPAPLPAAADGDAVVGAGTFHGQLAARPPQGALVVADDDQDAVMGLQLTLQWERVVGGQREQLIFGAMMGRVKEHVGCGSARGAAKLGNKDREGTGLKGWLKKHAPKVGESTAYRLMEIAEGIAADFHLKRVSLEDLLAASVETLDAALAKKREQIELMIDGKSQRQLLLEYGRAADGRSKNPGGFRPNALILRAWLEQEYPANPEYLDNCDCFSELPEEVQKRFKAEGKRYEERLTNEQKLELEEAEAARVWNEQGAQAIHEAQDSLHYQRATPEQNAALITALRDFASEVVRFESQRKTGKKGLPGK